MICISLTVVHTIPSAYLLQLNWIRRKYSPLVSVLTVLAVDLFERAGQRLDAHP